MRLPILLVAVLLPPLAVAWLAGLGKRFWANVVLTLALWVPGVVHALGVWFWVERRRRIAELEGAPAASASFDLARFDRRSHRRRRARRRKSHVSDSSRSNHAASNWPEWHDPPATNGHKPR